VKVFFHTGYGAVWYGTAQSGAAVATFTLQLYIALHSGATHRAVPYPV